MSDAIATVDKHRLEDARRVLRVLTAAYPSYPFGDDSVELYLAVIVKDMPDFAVAMRVATDWATGQLYFPKPVELTDAYLAEVDKQQRRATATRIAQQHHREGTVACTRCDDTKVVVVKWTHLDVVYEGIAPCERCCGEERDFWREGHMDVDHDVEVCTHPRCQVKASAKQRKRGER